MICYCTFQLQLMENNIVILQAPCRLYKCSVTSLYNRYVTKIRTCTIHLKHSEGTLQYIIHVSFKYYMLSNFQFKTEGLAYRSVLRWWTFPKLQKRRGAFHPKVCIFVLYKGIMCFLSIIMDCGFF